MDVVSMIFSRRFFVLGGASLSLLGHPVWNARAATQKKNLVIIMLRGGMDGLTAVPVNDRLLNSLRPNILVKNTMKLDGHFSLHPRLETFASLWKAGQATVVHGTNIPYTKRSHFEGQNQMETGATTPYTEHTGWLGRGIDAAELNGLAISLQMPLLLRGKITADNYFPTTLRIPSTDVFKKVASSFVEGDPVYEAMMAINSRPREMLTVKWREREPLILAKTAAEQLRSEEGPRIAVFDLDGFDTHSAQGGTDGEHGEKLSQYDNIVKVLKDNLGEAFDKTLVITLTEFGRKVEENGGYGTEHGYGTAILIAGGLVQKSQVYTDWPGLSKKALFEGQDLNSTIDARAVYCSAMSACFDVDFDYMRKQAFWNAKLPNLTEKLFKI
jgi:uncharacterized protein (DUF1501 family)